MEIRSKSTMATNCNYLYQELLPAEGPVAVCIVGDCEILPKLHVVRHVLEDGTNLKETKVREGYSDSKNAQRMREKRKDPEYRRRENERRREQRRAKKLQEKTVMEKIPKLSVLSESVSNVENYTGQKTKNYIVRKKVEMVEVTTYTHEKLEEKDKENRNDVIVYRNCEGKLERAWNIRP